MRSSIVADAVIFSGRSDVQKIATEQCKMKGVSNVMMPAMAWECIDALARFPKALLILDWRIGPASIANVLGTDRKKLQGESRLILLIADEVAQNVIATAAEYNVAQIFTEQVNAKNLGARLTTLLLGETMPSDFKKLMTEVAEARKNHKSDKAVDLLKAAVQKNPTNMRLRAELAESQIQAGQSEQALKTLENIENSKPPYLRGIHMRGRALMRMGQFEEATKAFESAQLLNPNDVDRLIEFGNALLQVDDNKKAEEKFDHALALSPDNHAAKVGKGTVKLIDGDVNEALSILRDISNDIELASIFNSSAVLNMRAKRHDNGMQLYQAALKALGQDKRIQARLYFNMGVGYRRWGKKEQAQTCFETAIKLDPEYAKAKTQLSVVNGTNAPQKPATPTPGSEKSASKPVETPGLDFVTDFSDFLAEEDEEKEANEEEKLFG